MYILSQNILKSLFILSGNDQKSCIETTSKTNLSEEMKWWKQKTKGCQEKGKKRKWHRKLQSEKEVLKPARSAIRLKLNGLIITIQVSMSWQYSCTIQIPEKLVL